MRSKKGKALKLAAISSQGAQETVVITDPIFRSSCPTLKFARDLDDVIDAFMGFLNFTLVNKAGLLRGSDTT